MHLRCSISGREMSRVVDSFLLKGFLILVWNVDDSQTYVDMFFTRWPSRTKIASVFACFRRELSTDNNGSGIQVGILCANMLSGQSKDGVQNGPSAIRAAGLMDRLGRHVGLTVRDHGSIEVTGGEGAMADHHRVRNVPLNARFNKEVSDSVADILRSNDICVTLGGDHSLSIGSVYGHATVRPNLCLLWVDAHPDLNTAHSSPSGNLHGMPLHFLLHDMQSKRIHMPEFDWCKPCISSPNIGFIAIRDIDPGEIAIMKNYNIPHCSIREIDRNGIAHCMEKILDMINPSGNRPIHLSYDIDALDPGIAPSTGTPVHGGLNYREAMYISEEVARSGCLSAMDLVEVNPRLGTDAQAKATAAVAVDVIAHALGLSIRDTDFRRFTRVGVPIV